MCEALIAVLLHHPRWRRDDAPVTLESQGGAPDEATSATMQDPNDFLTTDAARSFLADMEDEVCTTHLEQTQGRNLDGLTAGTGQVAQAGVESLQLQRQISDMVVLDAISCALQGEMGNARVLSDHSEEDIGIASESSYAKDKVVDDTTPTIEGNQ